MIATKPTLERAIVSVGLAILGVGTVPLALAAVIAYRVIHPVRARPTRILAVDSNNVTLENTALTRHDGVLGLLYDDEQHLAVLEAPLTPASPGHPVIRALRRPVDPPLQPGLGRPTGNTFSDAHELDPDARQVELRTPLGDAPAWVFPGRSDNGLWAVHIHGSLTGRDGAYRSVAALHGTGISSIVPSYRGDGEGPSAPRRAFMLGQTEWHDLEAALKYALDNGARRILLIGWSAGADIALRLAEESQYAAAVVGLVLISPVVDWTETVLFAVSTAHLPRSVGRLALFLLSRRAPSRLLGATAAISFRARTTSTRPLLLLHTSGDATTPSSATDALQVRWKGPSRLPALAPVPHALEWNHDPQRFATLVTEWLRTLPGG